MKDMFTAPFLREMRETAANMYRLGWGERNGGNISYLLDEEEAAGYLDLDSVIRAIPLGFDAAPLAGRIFLVTGTGKYFKNVEADPETNLGIVRIAPNGQAAELLWGYRDGGKFTSEFPAHLMSHMARLSVDPENRVVIHSHPTYTLAMNYVHELDEKKFTHTLWEMCTECIVVFPDGVGVLPWMLCGTNAIGQATAEKMKEFRLVIWGMHGIYGAGRTMDEAFGLIETVEKAAQTGAAAPAVPVTDTIKRGEKGLTVETVDRSSLWAVQTPQIFEAGLIRAAIEKAVEDQVELTDDCAAVERLGMKVSLTQGSRENIKITTPFDLLVGEAILDARGRGEL